MKERNTIIFLYSSELTSEDFAIDISRNVKTIRKWINRWTKTGEVGSLKNTGRPRASTIDDDLNISLQEIENPLLTRAQLKLNVN